MKRKYLGLLFVLVLLSTNIVLAQDETTPEVTQEEINQNIKDRLKKVAQEQDSLVSVRKKQAMIGELESLANDTLTIKTKDDIKLASVSAETDYVRNPGNKSADVDDVAIGDWVVAMGFVNGSEVLEARRVLLYSSSPEKLEKKSVFGTISNIDEESLTFSIVSLMGEELLMSVSTSSLINVAVNDEQEEIEFEEISDGQKALAIYEPDEDEESLSLLTLLVLPSQEPEENEEVATESATEEVEETLPPELGL